MNANYKELCTRKYIYRQTVNSYSVELFLEELKCLNFFDLLNGDPNVNPNNNYNILEGILTELIKKHMPIKKNKFHKYKHKRLEWITLGIIKSIKFRDNQYKRLKQTPQNTI